MSGEIIKSSSHRHRRFLKARESKVHENDKTALLIRGGSANNEITTVLKELFILKNPLSILFRKRNVCRPFEDISSVEFMCKKNDASLFMFGSNSKKRPNNLVIGRLYNYNLLDMVELGVENFVSINNFKGLKPALGCKPCLTFSGPGFDSDFNMMRLKSILIDFFRGPVVDNIRLSGLEHVIQFTAIGEKVLMRSYRIALKKSGLKTPRVELEDVGPNMDLVIRRTQIASDALFKQACRKPKAAQIKNPKNISTDIFGTKRGRVHMTKQDLANLQTRKMKALKRKLPAEFDQVLSEVDTMNDVSDE